jgi:hypothetical protein
MFFSFGEELLSVNFGVHEKGQEWKLFPSPIPGKVTPITTGCVQGSNLKKGKNSTKRLEGGLQQST